MLKTVFSLPAFYAFLSVAPWGFILFLVHPSERHRKLLISSISMIAGIISTQGVLFLHNKIWPEVTQKVAKKTSILTHTAHIAFIQAGMMEEFVKILLILAIVFAFCFSWKEKTFGNDSILAGGFVAIGFALIENFQYILRAPAGTQFDLMLGRGIHSTNIHLLINLCFALFLIKSNDLKGKFRILYILYSFFLAVFQHGVVDFFLIPSSRIGSWMATALFVGIFVWVVNDMRFYVLKKKENPIQVSL